MSVAALLRDAVGLSQAGRFDEADALCAKALAASPDHADALHVAGIVAFRRGRLDDAILLIRRAIARAPGNALFHGNLGNVYKDARRPDEAIASYRLALSLDPRHLSARNNLGVLLLERGDVDSAAAAFREVIDAQPAHFRAHCNLGNASFRRGDVESALASWRRALALEPAFAEALAQLGCALVSLGRFDEALPLLRRRVELDPQSETAHADLALALHRHGDLEGAARCYERAAELNPDGIEVLCNFCALLQKICDWQRLERYWPRVRDAIGEGTSGVPLGLLVSQPDVTPALQLAAARAKASMLEVPPVAVPVRARRSDERLRIGYLSADFREHATAWLVAELFELHDRDRFEIVLYSYGPDDGGSSRKRLQRAADRFVDLAASDDHSAARRIAGDGVDVLVDLNGNTDNGRMGIVALRPARVQVNWLGFPGTLGARAYDYLVADRFVVPAESERYYSEAIVRLPGCYQSHDRQRTRPTRSPGRAACGLADGAVVLCCFNQTFKITAPIFALWMRVLAAVPDAVLWLLDDNRIASETLRRRAAEHGVAAHRLVFASHCAHDLHLARYLAADLAIDTFPCVSHTTASDALWMGCPLITLSGETFASRVAMSVVANAGLPDCAATSMADYEASLIELAREPRRLAALRQRLQLARADAPLFDTPRFARGVESAYLRMVALEVRGERPRGFDVEAAAAGWEG